MIFLYDGKQTMLLTSMGNNIPLFQYTGKNNTFWKIIIPKHKTM